MSRRFGRTTFLALALILLWAEAVSALSYYAPAPQGAVGVAQPRVSQQLSLGPGERITAALDLALRPEAGNGAAGAGFSDTAGHWAATGGYLGAAAAAGIIRPEEYPGGRFEPDRAILREEIAVMLVRALGLEERALGAPVQVIGGAAVVQGRRFADAGEWDWPHHVAEAVRSGLISGYAEADGAFTFRPDRSATRAEAAAMLVRAVGSGM